MHCRECELAYGRVIEALSGPAKEDKRVFIVGDWVIVKLIAAAYVAAASLAGIVHCASNGGC